MCESPGSYLFRTITETKSGPDSFEESRSVTTFLPNICVTQMLYSLRLVLEMKKSKKKKKPKSSRLEFIGKISVNNFTLSDAENNTPGPLSE